MSCMDNNDSCISYYSQSYFRMFSCHQMAVLSYHCKPQGWLAFRNTGAFPLAAKWKKNPSIFINRNNMFSAMVAHYWALIRNDASSTWETASSSSSCGTALFSLARGSHSQWSCKPRRTHRCLNPPQPWGRLCLGKLPSGWRWRRPRGCGLLGPPQSQAAMTGGGAVIIVK